MHLYQLLYDIIVLEQDGEIMSFYFINSNSKVSSYDEIRNAFLNNKNKKKDWSEGKSAESLCRYWFREKRTDFDIMIKDLFGNVDLGDGYFEGTTKFDNYRGGPRNHDLLFKKVTSQNGQITIGIEAKGNEEYAELIKDKYTYAVDTRAKGDNSNLDYRLDAIFDSLNGDRKELEYNEFKELRYQFFSGLVGTITEANLNGSNAVLFLIHQFVTSKAIPSSLERNKDDLVRYLNFIGIEEPLKSGDIIEYPLEFKDTNKAEIKYKSEGLKVYIGYLVTKLNKGE